MRRDPRAYLWDALHAVGSVQDFTSGLTLQDYRDDLLRRSAVERQLEIVGEALNQLSKIDPDTAKLIPQIGPIVGFRNILVHGYAEIDHARVWGVVEHDLGPLASVLQGLLDERG
jgi:uncharacterized protein with HEPN domain